MSAEPFIVNLSAEDPQGARISVTVELPLVDIEEIVVQGVQGEPVTHYSNSTERQAGRKMAIRMALNAVEAGMEPLT